jgi:hypothetical protein
MGSNTKKVKQSPINGLERQQLPSDATPRTSRMHTTALLKKPKNSQRRRSLNFVRKFMIIKNNNSAIP